MHNFVIIVVLPCLHAFRAACLFSALTARTFVAPRNPLAHPRFWSHLALMVCPARAGRKNSIWRVRFASPNTEAKRSWECLRVYSDTDTYPRLAACTVGSRALVCCFAARLFSLPLSPLPLPPLLSSRFAAPHLRDTSPLGTC